MTNPPPEEYTASTILALGAVAISANAPLELLWIVVSIFEATEVSPNWVKLHSVVAPRV
jgi:hypothetical protein